MNHATGAQETAIEPGYRAELAVSEHSVRHLRHILRLYLTGWGLAELADSAEPALTELVANVVRHVPGRRCSVLILRDRHRVRVEVTDACPKLPCPVDGLELSGWVTYLDTEIEKDAAFAGAVGKRLPQLPRWRGAVVATYSPTARLDLTLAARYSDRSFATIDNSDHYANTFQGFGAFFVIDAHARYEINDHLAAGLGVTNLGDRSYFLFHPFPRRTVVADLKYSF